MQGSIPPAAAFENHMRELVALITAAGFTPTDTDLKQLTRAVRQGVQYTQATAIGGNPNTLSVVTTANGAPAITSYQIGLTLSVKIPADNTAATTITVDGLTAVSIIRANGANVQAGDLPANSVVRLVYDGTKFQVSNYFGFSSSITNNNTFTIDIPFADDTSTTPSIVTAAYSPAITALNKGDFISTKLKNTFNGPATITVNALPPKAIVRNDSTPTQRNDAFVNEMLLLGFDGTNFQICNQIGVPPLPALTVNIDWYVNTSTGNDSSLDGSAPTVSGTHGPFRTISRAITEVYKYNMNGFNATIHVADGTYTETLALSPLNGAGIVYLVGNTASPGNAVVQGPASASGVIQGGGTWGMDGFRVNSGTGPNIGDEMSCITIQGGKFIPGRLHFGNAVSTHFRVSGNSAVSFINAVFTIFGNAANHIGVGPGGVIQTGTYAPNLPSVIIANPVTMQTFASASGLGVMQLLYASITNPGNVTATKFVVSSNGVIDSGGNGINYYPGNTPGFTQSGGQYL